MSDGVTRATAAYEQMVVAPSSLAHIDDTISASTTVAENMASKAAPWDPLIQRLKVFTEIVDGISEVWCSATLTPTVVLNTCLCRSIRMQKWLGVSYPQHTGYGLSVDILSIITDTQSQSCPDCVKPERAR
jgi:hypothetical protein